MSVRTGARGRLWAAVFTLAYLATLPLAAPTPARAAVQPVTASSSVGVLAVSAGSGSTCAIRLDGTVACWGGFGQAPQPPAATTFSAVATDEGYACGIRADGSLLCWEAEDGMSPGAEPPGTYTSLSTRQGYTCAIRSDQAAVCWSGDDEEDFRPPPAGKYRAVSVGDYGACGILIDGTLTCWGGYPDDPPPTPPSGSYTALDGWCAIRSDGMLACWDYGGGVSRPLAGTFTAIGGTCAIKTDKTIACWGDEGAVEAPPSGTFKALSAGWDHACAIRTTGTLTCWGDDEAGAVKPRPMATLSAPAPWRLSQALTLTWAATPALAKVTTYDIQYKRANWNSTAYGAWVRWKTGTTLTTAPFTTSAGYTYCFSVRATDADGGVSFWTDPTDGEEETGCTATPFDERAMTRSAGWTAVSNAAYYGSTYLRATTTGAKLTATSVRASWVALVATTCPTCGAVKLAYGTLPAKTISLASPTRVDRRFIPVFDREGYAAGGTLTITVTSTGKSVLIDGVVASRADNAPAWADGDDTPISASAGSSHPITAVTAGGRHTCAVLPGGTLTCWGSNVVGESSAPSGKFLAVSAGPDVTCAIKSDHGLVCWGDEQGYDDRLITPPAGSFSAISVGTGQACAIGTSGALSCWGSASFDGGDEIIPPPADGPFASVSAGYGVACAIRTDGHLVCWGDAPLAAVRQPTGTFASVSVGDDHACAIRSDKTLVCWGRNDLHQAKPPAGTFTAVSVGDLHSCAIAETGGTISCWGDNQYLESTPPTGAFTALDAGEHHACAIRSTGTFACWGQDRSGQVTPKPTATTAALDVWLLDANAPVAWSATSLASITSYDVRYRRASWKGAFGVWTTSLTGTTATKGSFGTSAGYTYCYATRARDADGLVSAWSTERCTRTPLDDRSLTRSTGWTLGSGAAYYRATNSLSTTTGAKLTLASVPDDDVILLVATTCPNCGTVKVYLGSTLVRQVSLYSAVRVDRKVLLVTDWEDYEGDGTLRTLSIKVASTGKSVLIDGVAISDDEAAMP